MRSLPNFNPGAQLASGGKLRQMKNALRDMQMKPAYDFDPMHRWHVVAEGPGKIVAAGPNNETYPNGSALNEQYWVQPAYIEGAKAWDPIKLTKNQLANPKIVCATNLPETYTHSHALPFRKQVWIQAIWDRGTPSRLHWVMEYQPPWRLQVQSGTTWTDGSTLAGGVYKVRIHNAPTANFLKGTTTNETTTFGAVGTTDCLGVSTREMGASTHNIDLTGTLQPLVFPANILTIDDDEKTVTFVFDGLQGRVCP